MSKIITYKNEGSKGVFCQIKLDSGERVLISIGDRVVKIFKLFAGIIPIKTIWGPKTIAEACYIAFDKNKPTKTILDALVNKIIDCKSIEEIIFILKS